MHTATSDSSRSLFIAAEALGWTVSPLVMPIVGATVAAHALGASPQMTLWIGLATLVGTGLLPLFYIVHLMRTGDVDTLDVRERTSRVRPILFSALCMSAQAALLSWLLPADLSLVADLAWMQVVNLLLLLSITLFWKVSFHLSALSSVAGAVAGLMLLVPLDRLISPVVLGILLGLIPLLAWARVYVGAHTWQQTMVGTLFGLLLLPLEVALLIALR